MSDTCQDLAQGKCSLALVKLGFPPALPSSSGLRTPAAAQAKPPTFPGGHIVKIRESLYFQTGANREEWGTWECTTPTFLTLPQGAEAKSLVAWGQVHGKKGVGDGNHLGGPFRLCGFELVT